MTHDSLCEGAGRCRCKLRGSLVVPPPATTEAPRSTVAAQEWPRTGAKPYDSYKVCDDCGKMWPVGSDHPCDGKATTEAPMEQSQRADSPHGYPVDHSHGERAILEQSKATGAPLSERMRVWVSDGGRIIVLQSSTVRAMADEVAKLEGRVERHTDWYQQRFDRLRKWVNEEVKPLSADVATRYFSICANGAADWHESADWSNTIHAVRLQLHAAIRERDAAKAEAVEAGHERDTKAVHLVEARRQIKRLEEEAETLRGQLDASVTLRKAAERERDEVACEADARVAEAAKAERARCAKWARELFLTAHEYARDADASEDEFIFAIEAGEPAPTSADGTGG